MREDPMKAITAAIILVFAVAAAPAFAQNITPPVSRGNGMPTLSPDVVKSLAPTGTLRAGINLGNIVLAQTDANGELVGVTVELAREPGRRLNVPVEVTRFDAAGKSFEAMKAGSLDIVFLAIEPVRAAEGEFSAPYV